MSADNTCILGIDLGTGGPKVALVDIQGEILASAERTVDILSVEDGGVEEDPDQIWESVRSASKEVLEKAGEASKNVAAVFCCSQYSSVLPLDADGQPVMNLILWMDKRGAPYNMNIYENHPDAIQDWFEIHGIPPLPSGGTCLSHMLWLKHERPALYEKTANFVEAMDYVNLRLTGRCVANQCTAFMMLLVDNRRWNVTEYDESLVAMSGIDREKLPDLVPIDSVVGTVLPEVAQDLGLPPETKVFAATNDTQCGAVGTGTFQGSHGGICVGTTSVMLAHVDFKETDAEHAILSMPSPIPGKYMVMAENGLGGKALQYILENLVFANDVLGEHGTDNPYENVDPAVNGTEPGSDGLLFLPWLGGSMAPASNDKMRAGFLNISINTTRAHIARAVMEGVAYNLRWLQPAVEAFTKTEFEYFLFGGGGSVSDAWSQIMADVMNMPIHQMADGRHVNCRAGAMLAFHRLGLLSLDDISSRNRIKQVHTPRPEYRAVYDKMFKQFLAAFKQTVPIFEALND